LLGIYHIYFCRYLDTSRGIDRRRAALEAGYDFNLPFPSLIMVVPPMLDYGAEGGKFGRFDREQNYVEHLRSLERAFHMRPKNGR